jgi:hypothetical protein
MPLSKYYGGHGKEVMKAMKKTYGGEDKAESVFYATANKKKKHERGETSKQEKMETGPSSKVRRKHGV